MALLVPKPKNKKETSSRSGEDAGEKQSKEISQSVSHIDKTLVGFTGILNKKQTKQFQAKVAQYQTDQLALLKQGNDGGKDKKTTKKWRKVVEFLFKGLTGFFKAIGKIVSSLSLSKATGILGLLLGLFLMLKLGLLDTLIPAALGLLKTLIKGLIGYLPEIISFLYDLITEYVPMIINAIADALSDALGIKSEPLRALVKTLTWIVSLGFILNKVMGLFGKNVFSLIKYLPKVVTGIKLLFGAIKGLATFLLANPIVLIIVAIVAALILIWKYSKQINNFFDGLTDRFKKAGPLGKALMIALGGMLLIFAPLILSVKYLAKLFQSIKDKGVVGTLKDIADWFTNLMDTIENKILGLPKPVKIALAAIMIPFTGFILAIKGLVKLVKLIKKEGLKKAFEKIWDSIKNFFNSIIKKILEKFKPIADFFTTIGKKIGDFFAPIANKIKVIFATVGDTLGWLIDRLIFTISKIPGLGDLRGGAEKAENFEEFRLMKYAESEAGSSEAKSRVTAYAMAKRKGNVAAMQEAAQGMSPEEVQFAEAFADATKRGVSNLDAFSKKLAEGGKFTATSTKVFNTPVNNTSKL